MPVDWPSSASGVVLSLACSNASSCSSVIVVIGARRDRRDDISNLSTGVRLTGSGTLNGWLLVRAGILILGTINFTLWATAVVPVLVAVTGEALVVVEVVELEAGMRAFLVIVTLAVGVGAEVGLVAAINGAKFGLVVFDTVLTAAPGAGVGFEVDLVVETEEFLFLARGVGVGTAIGVCLLASGPL